MENFNVNNKNMEDLFGDEFQVFPQESNQNTWSIYNLFWNTLGYSTDLTKSGPIIPVSSSRFPMVDLEGYCLDVNETLFQFKSIGVKNPKTQKEFLLKKVQDFLGEDYKIPKNIRDAFDIVLEDPEVVKKLEELLIQANKISEENIRGIESKREVNFLRIESIQFLQLGEELYDKMIQAAEKHVEKVVTQRSLSEEEGNNLSRQMTNHLHQILTSVKIGLINKANLMNSQLVVDVIKLGAYELELDKPEEKRDYKNCEISNGGTRFFSGHSGLEKKYHQLSVEEQILFDEGYEFIDDETLNQQFWKKSLWQKPHEKEPLVYSLHIGLAQPKGDVREAVLYFDLSKLSRGPFTKDEAKIIFSFLAEAADASSGQSFEKAFQRYALSLKTIQGIGEKEAAIIKEAAKRFGEQTLPTIFSVTGPLGHPEITSHISVSRREEFLARANFVKLYKSRGFVLSRKMAKACAPAFKIPEFRIAFQEFAGIVAQKMNENQYPPFLEDKMRLDKKMSNMYEALKKHHLQMLDVIGPLQTNLYKSLITGINN